jgi:hypothetical protein
MNRKEQESHVWKDDTKAKGLKDEKEKEMWLSNNNKKFKV